MKTPNRDLLVLLKDEYATERFMEQEVEQINNLLFHFETLETFCIAHEVFDINKSRIIRKRSLIQQLARKQELKSFQFFCNKN
ncbi:MAG TPA: hypothetical protein VMI12_02470 [Puia sp.]|nr:hypothetical protein [Puia sp.]